MLDGDKDEDQLELGLGDDDDEIDVEVVDDTPPAEKPRRPEDEKAEIPDEGDDKLEKYSEGVQKRIKKLTFEARESERQRNEAQRQREEAISYARSVLADNERLQKQLKANQSTHAEQIKVRAAADLESAQAAYKQAYEAGDADALLKAQTTLNRAQADLAKYEHYTPEPDPEPKPKAQPQQTRQPQQQAPELTPRQREWLADNDWFGVNSDMTGYAYGVHERLVRSGVDPNSKSYYDQIDSSIRKRFPEEFSEPDDEDNSQPRPKAPATVVAPATRSTKKSRNKVRLTASQASIAKRLGLTNAQYAAQVIKDAEAVEAGNG